MKHRKRRRLAKPARRGSPMTLALRVVLILLVAAVGIITGYWWAKRTLHQFFQATMEQVDPGQER